MFFWPTTTSWKIIQIFIFGVIIFVTKWCLVNVTKIVKMRWYFQEHVITLIVICLFYLCIGVDRKKMCLDYFDSDADTIKVSVDSIERLYGGNSGLLDHKSKDVWKLLARMEKMSILRGNILKQRSVNHWHCKWPELLFRLWAIDN